MIFPETLRLPAHYSLEPIGSNAWELVAPNGDIVNRFSAQRDDNRRVQVYAWNHYYEDYLEQDS